MSTPAQWPGCHGVQATGGPPGLGVAVGDPLARATIRVGPVDPADGVKLWSQHGEADVGPEHFEVDRFLYRREQGTFVLTGSLGPSVEVDQANCSVTIAEGDAGVQLQLLATFAIPLIVHTTSALVLHGSACSLGDRTIVVCGDSGAGKSSLLVGLLDAGWTAVSEDLCTIDFRDHAPVVWPGPPWVRIASGAAGPGGSEPRFDSMYKTGWDIAFAQATEPRAVTHIVLLQVPGGDAPLVETVSRPDALRELARHAVWLGDQSEGGRVLFRPTSELISKIPTVSLRLPRSESWLDQVPTLLATAF